MSVRADDEAPGGLLVLALVELTLLPREPIVRVLHNPRQHARPDLASTAAFVAEEEVVRLDGVAVQVDEQRDG